MIGKLFEKLGVGKEDKAKKFAKMDKAELKTYVKRQELEMEDLDGKLEGLENELETTVRKGVGAPKMKKMRLGAQCRAKHLQLGTTMRGYGDKLLLYSIANTALAIKESGQLSSTEEIKTLEKLFGVKSLEELKEMLREIQLGGIVIRKPLEDLRSGLEKEANRFMYTEMEENEFVKLMESIEGEGITDEKEIEKKIKEKVKNKLEELELEKTA